MWVESVPFSFLFGGKKRKEFSLGYLETNQTTKQNTSVGSKWHSQKQGAGGAERSRPAPAWVVPDTASEEVPLLQTQKGLNCFRVISLAWRGQGLGGRASHRGGGDCVSWLQCPQGGPSQLQGPPQSEGRGLGGRGAQSPPGHLAPPLPRPLSRWKGSFHLYSGRPPSWLAES